MSKNAIVIGAKGRFGRAAVRAFVKAGWNVRAFGRNWQSKPAHPGVTIVEGDASDQVALTEACVGSDLIINGLNPPYERWQAMLPRLTANIIAAAKSSGATVMIPGNIYNFGTHVSPVLTEEAPQIPNSRKGKLRVEMEAEYRRAASEGVRTIILRGGDFIEREATGNWFDSYIAAKAHSGKVSYPGPLDVKHAWAYLPDMARAMARLAEKRDELAPFETFCFEGYALTGAELVSAIEAATGTAQKVSSIPWPVLRLMGLFVPRIREVLEMRYLWQLEHSIDGSKLQAVLPSFKPTPIEVAFRDALGMPGTEDARLSQLASGTE